MSCENCFKGHVIPGEPKGTLVNGAYFAAAGGDKTEGAEKKAVLLLTDIFGLALVNSKIMADMFAERLGVDVWVPDLFDGHPPMTVEKLGPFVPEKAGDKRTYGQTFRLLATTIIPAIPALYRARAAVVDGRVKAFIEAKKAEKGYTKIGAVGYCFGGTLAVRLAGTGLISTAVIAHPGGNSAAQIEAIKVPISWACAEEDEAFAEKKRAQAESSLEKRKGTDNAVDYEFKIYKGTAHGFAARPNLEIPDVKAGWEGALEQAVAWFKKTL
ncbi:dienelactone hydrolase endo-1,3,1,4-beta-D-glucanase [Auriscalpium vulgare]|uniref:Dienelactone hydrolase endo-1,3,1,4-beta-D-glucanase n=1 Tax=Auriscalpium vulgare TaxID=40419 RepID=A0ACB8RK99_9AGAM|nr:dienelactone hydrolase endo-1,3,1,4-beta-D-glucanase [Auriscalpium vulgare]